MRREGCSGVGEQGWSGSGGAREQREEEGGREKEKGNGEKKMRKEKKKIKRGGEKEKKGRRVGVDRGNRSRVADRRSSGAGWDTSEERERELRPTEKGTTVEIGCQDIGTKFREEIK